MSWCCAARCSIDGRMLDPRDAVRLPGATRLAAASEALLAVVTFLPDEA